jgi:hypothetical protein
MALLIVSPASAQQVNWVELLSIRDLTGNVLLQKDQPLIVGHSYNVTIRISVPFSQPTSDFVVALDLNMNLVGTQYWYVLTKNYGGYDPTRFTPGSRAIIFRQIQGQLVVAALFSVPSDITISEAGELMLHFAKSGFQIIKVTVTGGSTVGTVATKISDAALETYMNTYSQKSSLIPMGKIDKAYSLVVNGILQQAQVLNQSGLPEKATSLLNLIDAEAFPAPPNPSFMIGLMAGVGGLAAIAVILAVLLLRGRTKYGYASSLVGGVQKELAALEVTATQYDKGLADRLKSIRDRLGEVM